MFNFEIHYTRSVLIPVIWKYQVTTWQILNVQKGCNFFACISRRTHCFLYSIYRDFSAGTPWNPKRPPVGTPPDDSTVSTPAHNPGTKKVPVRIYALFTANLAKLSEILTPEKERVQIRTRGRLKSTLSCFAKILKNLKGHSG